VADRQQTPPRPIAESAVGDNDINRLFDTAGRQTAVPVAAPVLERLAEVMRSRVRPGQHVTAATTHSTPAGFQPLPTTNSLADTSFASTLQQQASDLIRTPVSEPAWGDRMGQRVVMLAANQLKTAEIRLTPAELGPVRVKVSIEDGAANVTFQAAHAVTREALEQALPRLREMLAENGLTLGQADVGDQGVAQGNGDSDSDSAAAGLATDDTGGHGDETDLVERQRTLASDSLVDTFA
jgi:flagellar hook-length control protein FliK